MDLRVINVSITMKGFSKTFSSADGFNIRVMGNKTSDTIKNDCTVSILGLSSKTITNVLTDTLKYRLMAGEGSPLKIFVEIGRESGIYERFVGDIVEVRRGLPPDNELLISAYTSQMLAQELLKMPYIKSTTLSNIASKITYAKGLNLKFEASDKKILDFSFTGSAETLLNRLPDLADVNAFIDNDTLVVMDKNKKRRTYVLEVNKDTIMVGIPSVTGSALGKLLKIEFFISAGVAVGGLLRVKSIANPTANGTWKINRLTFIAESHGDRFFYNAECTEA